MLQVDPKMLFFEGGDNLASQGWYHHNRPWWQHNLYYQLISICANLFLALPTLKPCTPIMKTGLFESLIHSSIFSLRIWTFSLLESIKVQIMWRLVGNVWTIADNKIIGSWWFASLFLVSSNTFGKFGDCCHPTGVVGCCRRPILPKNQIENHFL